MGNGSIYYTWEWCWIGEVGYVAGLKGWGRRERKRERERERGERGGGERERERETSSMCSISESNLIT